MRGSERLAVLITVAVICVAIGYLYANRIPADSYRIRTVYNEDILFERENAAAAFAPNASPLAPRGRININTATSNELQDLPGIGPAIAQRIITYRTENGPFESVDDMINVSGIGEKTLDSLRDLITV